MMARDRGGDVQRDKRGDRLHCGSPLRLLPLTSSPFSASSSLWMSNSMTGDPLPTRSSGCSPISRSLVSFMMSPRVSSSSTDGGLSHRRRLRCSLYQPLLLLVFCHCYILASNLIFFISHQDVHYCAYDPTDFFPSSFRCPHLHPRSNGTTPPHHHLAVMEVWMTTSTLEGISKDREESFHWP